MDSRSFAISAGAKAAPMTSRTWSSVIASIRERQMIAMRVGVHCRPRWPTAITCTFNRSEGAHYLVHLRAASALRLTDTSKIILRATFEVGTCSTLPHAHAYKQIMEISENLFDNLTKSWPF
jgi:hypothetical protein